MCSSLRDGSVLFGEWYRAAFNAIILGQSLHTYSHMVGRDMDICSKKISASLDITDNSPIVLLSATLNVSLEIFSN